MASGQTFFDFIYKVSAAFIIAIRSISLSLPQN
jgi:hypothetical protein